MGVWNKFSRFDALQPTLTEASETGTEVSGRTNACVMSGCGAAGTDRQIIAARLIRRVFRTQAVAVGRQSHRHILSGLQI